MGMRNIRCTMFLQISRKQTSHSSSNMLAHLFITMLHLSLQRLDTLATLSRPVVIRNTNVRSDTENHERLESTIHLLSQGLVVVKTEVSMRNHLSLQIYLWHGLTNTNYPLVTKNCCTILRFFCMGLQLPLPKFLMIREALLALVEWIGSCRRWCFPGNISDLILQTLVNTK